MAHGVRHGVVQIGKGKRAMERLPVATHSVNGPHLIEFSGAWMGEKELACNTWQRRGGLSGSGLLTYRQLKLLPQWDPLRGDPCFEKIVASLAPKS